MKEIWSISQEMVSGETNGISLLNLKTNKINAINPVECHSFLGGHYSLGDTAPYAVEMECDGVKDSIPLEPKSRDAQILQPYEIVFQIKN